ncbi:alpha/beta fold hydrolase [Streptomyces sp. NBRC 109706]|uniref:alpha/beta fold hydrolase n=1 Tax=Streptomyces sp. NBRC 109706 TaxID=1550035 RepID=UPI000781C128|nr:alpha/beta fold hydrolase [Streptomyces sp. NBRC 109706]
MASHHTNTVFVLVHGAWHSSWQWAETQRALAARGAASVAVDLPGHGFAAPLPAGYLDTPQTGLTTERSPVADITLDAFADSVLGTLRAVHGRYRTTVLVAHSAGGGAASLAVERAPELVDRVVYVSAFVPAGRPRFFDYIGAPENATSLGQGLTIGDPERIGAVRINPHSPDPAYAEELRASYYHDLPADRFARWRLALSPDLPLAVPATPITLTAERWGRVPRTYLRCSADRALVPATQDLMVAEADARTPDQPFEVRQLPSGHSPFATHPTELAAQLTLAAG